MKDDNCIFCKIVAGEVPAHKVYEDENCLAFLDINPKRDGHTLLIPKNHYPWMIDTPDAEVATIFITAKKLMAKLGSAMEADFVSVDVIGTDIPHFHIHLTPRHLNDELHNLTPRKQYKNPEHIAATAEKIRKLI